MNLKDFIELTRFARQLCDVLDIAGIIHDVFHQLQQFRPGQGLAAPRHVGDRAIHTIGHAPDAGPQLIGGLRNLRVMATHSVLRRINLLL